MTRILKKTKTKINDKIVLTTTLVFAVVCAVVVGGAVLYATVSVSTSSSNTVLVSELSTFYPLSVLAGAQDAAVFGINIRPQNSRSQNVILRSVILNVNNSHLTTLSGAIFKLVNSQGAILASASPAGANRNKTVSFSNLNVPISQAGNDFTIKASLLPTDSGAFALHIPDRNVKVTINDRRATVSAQSVYLGPIVIRRESNFGIGGAPQFADEMIEAGIEITRQWIDWDKIEPANNSYDWTEMDATIRAYNDAGIEVLGYFIGMPVWARDTSNPRCVIDERKMGDFCVPKNWADYEDFARDVARRYNGTQYICGVTGDQYCGVMKYIGVWNEVQLFSSMTAEEYAPFLTKGYAAIKQGNPNAKVSIGSFLDPYEFSYSGAFIDVIFRDYSNYFDITDFHVYRKEAGASETSRYIKERMDNFGIDKPMWITETATNLATIPCNLDWYDDIAIDVVKRYSRAFAEGVDKVFWFAFIVNPVKQENAGGIACGGPSNFNTGFLGWSLKGSTTFHPRPAYTAYKTMTSKLAGFSEVVKLSDTGYRFKVDDLSTTSVGNTQYNESYVYVLWCDSGTCSIPSELSAVPSAVWVTDYLGNRQLKTPNQITLTNSPIFVETYLFY
ncbi:MAG: glycosyl hydrolase [Patescibacteria group bacterium]